MRSASGNTIRAPRYVAGTHISPLVGTPFGSLQLSMVLTSRKLTATLDIRRLTLPKEGAGVSI